MIDQGIKMLEICGYGKLIKGKKYLKFPLTPTSQLCCCWPSWRQPPSYSTKDDQEKEGGNHPGQRWTQQPLHIFHNQPNQVDHFNKIMFILVLFYCVDKCLEELEFASVCLIPIYSVNYSKKWIFCNISIPPFIQNCRAATAWLLPDSISPHFEAFPTQLYCLLRPWLLLSLSLDPEPELVQF